jgi:hypothetical protein
MAENQSLLMHYVASLSYFPPNNGTDTADFDKNSGQEVQGGVLA